jgi:hypothetical protein
MPARKRDFRGDCATPRVPECACTHGLQRSAADSPSLRASAALGCQRRTHPVFARAPRLLPAALGCQRRTHPHLRASAALSFPPRADASGGLTDSSRERPACFPPRSMPAADSPIPRASAPLASHRARCQRRTHRFLARAPRLFPPRPEARRTHRFLARAPRFVPAALGGQRTHRVFARAPRFVPAALGGQRTHRVFARAPRYPSELLRCQRRTHRFFVRASHSARDPRATYPPHAPSTVDSRTLRVTLAPPTRRASIPARRTHALFARASRLLPRCSDASNRNRRRAESRSIAGRGYV